RPAGGPLAQANSALHFFFLPVRSPARRVSSGVLFLSHARRRADDWTPPPCARSSSGSLPATSTHRGRKRGSQCARGRRRGRARAHG
ncbi:hypothetical protein U9M48_037338, partial [Paspalum notatum var. saurae]